MDTSKNNGNRIRQFIYNAGVSDADYEFVRPILKKNNDGVWQGTSVDCIVLSFVAFVLTYFVDFLAKCRICAVFCFLVAIINMIVTKKTVNSKSVFGIYRYFVAISLIGVVTVTSCFEFPNLPVFMPVMLIMFFMYSTFDRPVFIIISNLVVAIFQIVMIYMYKEDFQNYSVMEVVFVSGLSIRAGVSSCISKAKSMSIAFKHVDSLEDEKKKSRRHISALASLSNEYRTVFYGDLADNVIEDMYSLGLQPLVDEVGENVVGTKISDLIQKFCDDYVYVEDSANVKNVLDINNIMAILDEHKPVTVRYRVVENGLPVYYEIKVIKDEHGIGKYPVIFAAKNVDVEVRLDMVFQANFENAKQNATKDLMTGVKNKGAFEGKCQEFMQRISDGEKVEFAMVMCDVNGLKKVNDTLGHDEGDKLIMGVCKIVSRIYGHSPVYRVGGDEFLAVLTDDDYHMKDELLMMAREQGISNVEGVSFASGMAVYDPNIDKDVHDVFKRADAQMYENKVKMKGCRED